MINDKDPYASSAVARTATCSSLDDAFNGSAIAWCEHDASVEMFDGRGVLLPFSPLFLSQSSLEHTAQEACLLVSFSLQPVD